MDYKKLLWFLGFLVVASISCWATSSSLHLMMPTMPILAVWGMTVVFYLLASFAVKWIVDSLNNDGSLTHPKVMFWGGLAILAFTWIIVSLPTNAHTFFYKLKIGDVVTQDLNTTKGYSQQIADRVVVVDSAYFDIEEKVKDEFEEFVNEVKLGVESGKTGFGKIAVKHISKINTILPSGYSMQIPQNTNNASDAQVTNMANTGKAELDSILEKLKSDKYLVPMSSATAAKKDVDNIIAMEDSVHQLKLTNQISEDSSEPIITQSAGVLTIAYANIKNCAKFVKFNNEDEHQLYTAANIETKTNRFLNPYSLTYDYFTGKIPFTFTFWLFLSILIDVSGFFFYYQATKKTYNF